MRALTSTPSHTLAGLLRRLIVPRVYALIGLGAFLLIRRELSLLHVEAAHRLTLAAPVTFLASAAGLVALIVAARAPAGPQGARSSAARWELAGRAVMTVIMAAMALASFLLVIAGLYAVTVEQPSSAYLNDVISFSAANAHALLAGRNPYTDDANFIPTLLAYPHAPPTPIQGPIFGSGYDYPLQPYVFRIDQAYIHDPSRYAAAFDPRTLHSYPALSFLIYVPLFLLGIQNVMWVNMAAYAALLLWLVSLAPRGQRGWVAFTGLAALTITFGSLLLETELICLLFLLPAWRLRDRRGWASALLLGLGLRLQAVLLVLRAALPAGRPATTWLARSGPARADRAGGVPGAQSAVHSRQPGGLVAEYVAAADCGVFPAGHGTGDAGARPLLAAAVQGGLYDPRNRRDWAPSYGCTRATMAGCARQAPLLALVPFFFAFRSPPNYFAVAPWLALFAWLWLQRERGERMERVVGAAQDAKPALGAV